MNRRHPLEMSKLLETLPPIPAGFLSIVDSAGAIHYVPAASLKFLQGKDKGLQVLGPH